MKKRKKAETTANANPPPQSIVNPLQTTIEKPTKPTQSNPSQSHHNPLQIITIIWATPVLGARARSSSSPPRSPVTQSGEREIGKAHIRLRPPRSPPRSPDPPRSPLRSPPQSPDPPRSPPRSPPWSPDLPWWIWRVARGEQRLAGREREHRKRAEREQMGRADAWNFLKNGLRKIFP